MPETSPFFLEAKLTLTRFAILYQKTVSMSHGWDDFLSLKQLFSGLLSENVEVNFLLQLK